MKHNQNIKNRMSTFELKQQFIGLLAGEFENCSFDIVLGFESSFRNRICTLKFVNCKQVEVCVNLGYVKKSVCVDGCSLMFKVFFCASYVAEYIKQIERAGYSVPQSYFEGLAFLNAIEVYKSEKLVSVYSPILHWETKPKRSYCLRPLEVSCAINSLNKIKLLASSWMNQQEKLVVNTFCNSLLLYAGLPEVSYNHSRVPVYALIDAFKKLADLIVKEPLLSQEFPILTLAPFEQIQQMSVNDLLLHCIQSNNEFLMGVAIRLIAFLHPSQNIAFADDIHNKLADTINQYIDYSLSYCYEFSKSGRCLKTDNLYAIKAAAKSIDEYLNVDGIYVIAGNIHSIM